MQYIDAYTYYFDNENWVLNLLLTTVCQLIPVVGPIVMLGYEYELIVAKHRRTAETYPDFDFGRFTDYLTRGIWPFLVQMILWMALVPVIMVVFLFIAVPAGLLAQGPQAQPMMPLLMFPAMFLVMIVLQIVSVLVITPLALRAGLMQNFGQAFDMAFVKDFIHRMWWETIVASLFLVITGWILMMLGMLACFIGMYPAITLVQLAHTHLIWQLYELYLDRGGMPIPLVEDQVIMAVRV